MCGISGIFQKEGNPVDLELLTAMGRELVNRGPDAHGIYIKENLGLFHRRLKVLDLSEEANQPFFSENRGVCVVYNGEVYNFIELREELQKKGRSFRTKSDTEVLVQSFEEWGTEAFSKWNGMFALALLDLRERQPSLYLVRDRFGIKPLFYALKNGSIAFSSVLSPLMKVPWVSRSIDSQALLGYLQLSHVHSPHSILAGVKQVPPGWFLFFKEGELQEHEYWDLNRLNAVHSPRRSDQDWLEEFEEILRRVILRQTLSDVPLGCFLSGGIDSSLMASIYSEVHPHTARLKTYSIGYQERDFDESSFSKIVSEKLNTDHHFLKMTEADGLELAEKIPQFFDQPMGDPTLLSSLALSRFARQEVTVALSGDGADEMFFGYPYQLWIRNLKSLSWVPSSIRKGVFRAIEALTESDILRFSRVQQLRKLSQILQYESEAELFSYFIGMVGPLKISQVTGLMAQPSHVRSPLFERLLESISSSNEEDQIIQVFMRTFLVDTVLTKADRTGMAYGLEVRVPFLDNEMADFSSRLPFHLKYQNGVTKILLRRSLEKRMPSLISKRKKQGFSIPLRHWLIQGMRPLLEGYLNENRLRNEGVFVPARVRQIVNEHMQKKANHSHLIWTLLCFQLWKEKFRL